MNDRLKAAREAAARIQADIEAEKAGRLKTKAMRIYFSETEYTRLKAKADENGLKLHNYIRKILSTYG